MLTPFSICQVRICIQTASDPHPRHETFLSLQVICSTEKAPGLYNLKEYQGVTFILEAASLSVSHGDLFEVFDLA